jgi:3-hydroxyisobutyrate dehydrogenase
MKSVGVIGLGIMGGAMARNMAAAGWEVVGYDVSEPALQRLREAGGTPLSSVEEVARKTTAIVTALPAVGPFDAVMQALAASCGPEHVVIDTCVMALDAKQRAFDWIAPSGAQLLDCPVSGTGAQAAVRDLVLFASGDAAAFEKVRPVTEAFSRRQVYLGKFGSGSTMKFIANHLVNIHNVAAAEALVLAARAGLDLQLVYDTLADSAGSSRMFQVRGPLMVAGKYDEPTARIDMYMKDLDIISRFAAELRCPTPLFNAATQLYYAAQQRGLGAQDTAAVCEILESLAGLPRRGAAEAP